MKSFPVFKVSSYSKYSKKQLQSKITRNNWLLISKWLGCFLLKITVISTVKATDLDPDVVRISAGDHPIPVQKLEITMQKAG